MAFGNVRSTQSSQIVYMYNNTNSKIDAYHAVKYDIATGNNPAQVQDPAAEAGSIKSTVCPIATVATGDGNGHTCGIAQEDIAAASWGRVCIFGKCTAQVDASGITEAFEAGAYLTAANSTDGHFDDGSATPTGVYLLEDTSDTNSTYEVFIGRIGDNLA